MAAVHKTNARLDNIDRRFEGKRRGDDTDDGGSVRTARPEETIDHRASVTDGSDAYHDHEPFATGRSPLIRGETDLDPTEHMTYAPMGSVHHHDGSHLPPESRLGREDEVDTVGAGLDVHALGTQYLRSEQGSVGDQVYEQELYKLRMKPPRTDATHQTWDVTHADPAELMPEIPDSDLGNMQGRDYFDDRRVASPIPPVPPKDGELAVAQAQWHPPIPAPWQRIHQRLLDWAMVWPLSEFDKALNSTTRGNQVDEIALTIWTTQTYKRYVRVKLAENPPGTVDKMFVPPIVADAISSAVFSGRHSDASAMLRDLWVPFGLENTPRLIIVLAKNRRRENHWVVHR